MEKSEIESALQILSSLSKDGRKYMQMCDHIRFAVSPSGSYPGVIEQLPSKVLRTICQVFCEFSSCITNSSNKFGKDHFSRAVDAMNKASLAYAILYVRYGNEEMFSRCLLCIEEGMKISKNFVPNDAIYLASSAFNIGAYIFKAKEYQSALELFKTTISLTSNGNSPELEAKAYQWKAQCLIAIGKCNSDSFIESIERCSDKKSVINSWIGLDPPSNPTIIATLVGKIDDSDINIMSYFVLNGFFSIIPIESELYQVFPEINPPKSIVSKHDQRQYETCASYFRSLMFLECKNEAINFLKSIKTERLTSCTYLVLMFIYYWIVESNIALDMLDEALWYAKQMRKLLEIFPFASGFGTFLEMKCRIKKNDFDEMKPVIPLQFKSSFNWKMIDYCIAATRLAREKNEECFRYFQYIIDDPNPIIKSEIMHYYASACRLFGVYPDLNEIMQQCIRPNDVKAMYLYHRSIQQLMAENIDDFWSYNNPVPPPKNILNNLKEAEKYAFGRPTLLRKILQLQALAIGTNDHIKTAFILTTSLSQSLDKFIPSTSQNKFQIPFPILSIAYLRIPGLDKCLLFALYHPTSRPLVVRIPCKSEFDDIIDEIDLIEEESTAVPHNLKREEWWTIKHKLDFRLEKVIAQLEKLLGVWRGLFAPIMYKPNHSTSISTLITSLFCEKEHREQIEMMIGHQIDLLSYTQTKILSLSLILGKTVHRIPWESLPVIEKFGIAVTRIPSLRLVALHSIDDSIPIDVDPHCAYFVLNPVGDLDNTEKTFADVFEVDFEWDGRIGSLPDKETIHEALQNCDLFVYCGHGSGNEYFNYTEMIEHGQKCRASMLLMGCKSCELNEEGDSDPRGVPVEFIIAGAGSVVGNLWNVTDRDIDRFLLALLNRTVMNGPCTLEEAVLQARNACKLRYLTGAAPVIYGFPTVFKSNQ
ncbi:Clan CD, family C50, separase-like cysteine peptidase [Tritrichomonas foetus]|uniref:separase n=1 Tax=Tritrichomonas foetus TaxID=1144522 RepID=A0A1J4JX23_9EUKA|nr:Clan CD, family C50, separase-like cysteine peptidase [Tritrichomonas foetus]|eukprot:OHT02086.1 Clan CD, family C50, separase-like cysteine peptidase [Tritrichomonas foetus]